VVARKEGGKEGGKVMDSATENRIDKQTDVLMNEHNIGELRTMHRQTFGVETKTKDKRRIASKLAEHIVTGNGQKPVQSPAPTSDKQEEDEVIARNVLAKIKNSWDEIELLTDEKKSKLSEIRQGIGKARDAIGDVLKSDELDATKKLTRLEGHWRRLRRNEDKATEIKKDYGERIKAAKTTMKSEMDNVRQIPLFG
jgi:hypothetical protein